MKKLEADSSSVMTTGAQSVGRALELLRMVSSSNREGLRLSEAVARTGLSKATIHRLLKELAASGLLMQNGDRRYHLGRFAYELGLVASAHFQIRETCAPFLERIAQETGDTVFLVMRSSFDSFCLDRKTGGFPIKVFAVEVGNRQPLGVGAGGLALLSFLPEQDRREVLEHNDRRLPAYNGLSTESLARMIERTRSTGHSLISNYAIPGITGVGIPVLDRVGCPIVAVSVTSISQRMTEARQQAVLLAMRREVQALREILVGPAAARR